MIRISFALRTAAATVFAACTACSGGCGSASPMDLTSVSGAVTWEGTPLTKGTITFMPAGTAGQSATAEIANGNYELGTFNSGDGVPAGEYQVAIQSWLEEPTMESPGKPAIPAKYHAANTSGLKATVAASGAQTIDFVLPVAGG